MIALICAIYVRVSTNQQVEGTSLETQIDQCKAAAFERGYQVNPEFIVRDSWTGDEIERPALDGLRAAVASGVLDAVMVYSADRLSRDPVHLLMLLREFTEAGVTLESVLGSFDTSAEGQFLTYVQGYVGQMERKQIAERTMRGKEQVAKSGRLPCGTGAGLYGYDYDPVLKVRTVNEVEAEIVKLIFQWADAGVSRHLIAKRLNEANIPSKRGNLWHPLTVERVLRNQAYTGVQFYGTKRYRKARGVVTVADRPESEWVRIEGFTPAIISEAMYWRVQERLNESQAKASKEANHQRYLLTGFSRCSECGTGLVGANMRKKYRYYRCRATFASATRPATCKASHIRADELEALVWDKVTATVIDPDVLIRDLERYLGSGEGDLAEKSAALRREIDDLKGQQRRLIELRQKDMVDQGVLESQLAPVKVLCDAKESELRVLSEQQKVRGNVAEAGQRIRVFCKDLAGTLEELDFDGRRATLAAMGVAVEATRDYLSIRIVVNPEFTAIAHTLA